MKKVFITGISGFAGSFLAEHLLDKGGFDVSGTYVTDSGLSNLTEVKDKVDLHKVDLMQKGPIYEVVEKIKPDWVIHLAALASPSLSFKQSGETITNNITAQLNLLEAVRLAGISPRMLIISSADIYGLVSASDFPIDEQTPLNPTSPYAVSKVAQDFLALQYFLSYSMPVIRVRPFNHIGPRQSPNFVVSSFAKKISDIEKGKQEPVLTVGNLSPKRDFTDVRDMVKAYGLALDKGEEGQVYNLGSGASHAIKEIVDLLIGMAKVPIEVKVDKSLFRPADAPELVADFSKFQGITGWKPEIDLDKTLKDTLDYFRNID